MYKMYLDDIRNPPDPSYVVVRTYWDAVHMVEEYGCPEFISFDNDLGTEKEGKDFMKWLIESDLEGLVEIPQNFTFKVHSWNYSAKKYMERLMTQYLRNRYSEA